ncbi:hypothetical protein CFC21_048246 [Triticum aestivum]|uniref:Late embryogenesis abundant protein LEA-2 subgroup domain-containing protein n=3 Tax=Triticinae TaxID=1648030 RepID=A0A9R1G025_WHEAT|nr:NDR1/HIN1-like protein 13 [Aegilops tauschii subsp. strangulata]KAF7037993.1 hypothetical protein CFC21_048246 [Triticum aestivum]
MDERQSFGQRHPVLAAVLLGSVVLAATLMTVLAITLESTPPEFSATVSSFDGLDRRAGAPPTFHVNLRVKNGNVWRHCFEPAAAVVEYDGVPLASADLGKLCVPARNVLNVPFVASGEGLGMPDQLYERLDGLRRRQERVPLAVRLTLEEKDTVKQVRPWLLRCTAMLDGRPDLPSRCLLFFLVEPGNSYYK